MSHVWFILRWLHILAMASPDLRVPFQARSSSAALPISPPERPREEHASWSGAGLAPCHYQAGGCARADRPADPLVEGLVFGGESVALSG